MSDRLWFTPAEGLRIVDPHTNREVDADGQWVGATDAFYQRRRLDRDGTLTESPPAGVRSAAAEH